MQSYHTIIAAQNLPSAVVFIEVEKPDKKLDLGTAFHVGGGFFATARHIVAGNKISRIGRNDLSLKTILGPNGQVTNVTTFGSFEHTEVENIFFHENEKVDIAIVQLAGNIKCGFGYPVSKLQPAVQLTKYADKLTEGELLMAEVLVLGFPRIPMTTAANVVAFKGEISATVTSYEDKKRHFVVSGMARGGFSGGPIFLLNGPVIQNSSGLPVNSTGTVIGVVGKSLVGSSESSETAMPELGFLSAISVEALRETVAFHKLPLEI